MMSKFKVGDTVYMCFDGYDGKGKDFGVITRKRTEGSGGWWIKWETGIDAGSELWSTEENLRLLDETQSVQFKIGDRVKTKSSEGLGVISKHGISTEKSFWCVDWDCGFNGWVLEDHLQLVEEQPNQNDAVETYTVAEFKKLLDKMDGNLILQMTNLRIGFKN